MGSLHGLKPLTLMLLSQFISAGVNIFYKLAVNDGMDLRVIVAYRFIFATAFLAPIAFFFERKNSPKLTWVVIFQAFLSGLFGGALSQNLYIESLALTSPTFASAITQLIPALTFVLAVAFGLERLNWRSLGGKAKVLGTLVGMSGAVLMTFYKGLEIHLWSTHADLLHHSQQPYHNVASSSAAHQHGHANSILGCFLALGCSFSYALWLNIQAKMGERYPSYYSSAALMSLMGSIQSVGFALCVERDWNQWKLGWNVRLLTVIYLGIVGTGVSVTCTSLAILMRGPLYASVFGPLVLVLVAVAGSLLFAEILHLGSVVGAVLIVVGLYSVLWGKGKDLKKMTQSVPAPTTNFEEESAEVSLDIVSVQLDSK